MRESGQVKWNGSALRLKLRALRVRSAFSRLRLKAGFNPNQPRVPAGSPDGGRWTDTGASAGGRQQSTGSARQRTVRDLSGEQTWSSYTQSFSNEGSLRSTVVNNRDGSRISEVYRGRNVGTARIQLRDGEQFRLEVDGSRQRIFDSTDTLVHDADWPLPDLDTSPVVVPVLLEKQPLDGPRGLKLGVGSGGGAAAIGVYNWWLSAPVQEKTPVFVFRAEDYERKKPTHLLEYVGRLPRHEVEQACAKLNLTQKLADEAARAHPRINFISDATRGTAIHKTIRDRVDAYKDPFFRAEVSASKSRDAEPRYGEKGSVRVDVMELREDNVACVYDVKSGVGGLTWTRIREIAENVANTFGNVNRIIVIEVRPAL